MLQKSKKRIAKNTFMLYCRMILIMGVALYTSRVLLNALGVIDYGVYNVVGGVVTMLGFFNSSIGTSTQRFLNVGMAENSDKKLKLIFSTSVNVHLIIGLITVALLETVGLWFVANKLVIPESQHTAAMWVYQCSVLSFFISIISAPYNAAIIAHERMSAFAFFSIIEAGLKLSVAFAIMYYPENRLKLYAILLLITTIIMRILYGVYCSKAFKSIRYELVWNLKLIKEMMSFSGWMIFGCLSDLLGTQGVNMLINVFFGPIFNASRAIAVQVQSAVAQFSTNFIISVNPQIVKSYSAKDYNYAYNLVFTASKLSFFLMLILIIPIILRSESILKIWLDTVPQYTSIFVILILVEYLIRSSYTPIAQINQAGGKIKIYQLSISVLFLINFALSYSFFRLGFPVYTTFIISALISIIGLFTRLFVLWKQQNFPAGRYLKDVSLRISIVAIIAFIVNSLYNKYIPDTFSGILLVVAFSLIINISLIWIVGLNAREREFCKDKAKLITNKVSIRTK